MGEQVPDRDLFFIRTIECGDKLSYPVIRMQFAHIRQQHDSRSGTRDLGQ